MACDIVLVVVADDVVSSCLFTYASQMAVTLGVIDRWKKTIVNGGRKQAVAPLAIGGI